MTTERLSDAIKAFLIQPDRRPIYEWANHHVKLPPAVTIQGLFDVSRSRHLIGPLDALADDHVREVTVVAPVRGGKTLLADLWVPWIIVNDPGPIMWNWQTDKKANDHCEERLWPVLEACEPVTLLFPSDRHKMRTAAIIFPHMSLVVQGPATTNLQSKGVRYLINDEVWQYAPGKLEEATGRVGDFQKMHTSKILNLSQAGNENDDLDVEWNKSSRREWLICCEKCGHFMPPKWTGHRADGTRWGMMWDTVKRLDDTWDLSKVLPTVRWECEKCAHPHIDTSRTKSEWNRTGKYVQTNPDALRKSEGFHWSQVIDFPWDEMVNKYLTALDSYKLGNIQPLIQFFQKRMAESKSEGSFLEGAMNFSKAEYQVDSDWPAETHRCMTIDRQENWFWILAHAWSKTTGETRRLYFGRKFSEAEIEVERERFKIRPNHTFIDSGYMAKGPDGVYAACRRFGWVAVKGDKAKVFTRELVRNGKRVRIFSSFADPIRVDPESGQSQSRGWVQMIRYSSDVMADRVRSLIDHGKLIIPSASADVENGTEYKRQMADEFKTKETDKYGRAKWTYVSRTGNNHAWDCSKMQALFATLKEILADLTGSD